MLEELAQERTFLEDGFEQGNFTERQPALNIKIAHQTTGHFISDLSFKNIKLSSEN